MVTRHPLFRAQALQAYAQSRERNILPRLVRPPVLLCCWLLLGLLLVATLLAWQTQVPISVATAGIIMTDEPAAQGTGQAMGLLFVPATPSPHIPPGQPISVQLTRQATPLRATIDSVEPGVLSPEAARQRYGLTGDLAWVITQPSLVVTITLNDHLPAFALRGSSIHAQMRVGSQSLLSLLPALLKALW